MNLLYFTIIIPLISFAILICFGRRLKIENIWLTGFGSILLTTVLLAFCLADFCNNEFSDFELSYQRILWHWLTIGDLSIDISLQLDRLSIIFLVLPCVLSLIVFSFAGNYLQSKDEIYHFFAYGNLLLSSLFILFLADNLLLFFLGWQAVSYCSFLMFGLKYKNERMGRVAIKDFCLMHLIDLFLLIGICLIFTDLKELRIQQLLIEAKANLAIDSNSISMIALFLFLAAIGRMGLFPFQPVFLSSTIGSMPVVMLLQSGVAIMGGGYLMLRFHDVFMMSSDVNLLIGILASATILVVGISALVLHDIKHLISYCNLLQFSLFFFIFIFNEPMVALCYLAGYSFISCFAIFLTGLSIQVSRGERNITKMGLSYKTQPILFIGFILLVLIYSSLPFISSLYYLMIHLIHGLQAKGSTFLVMIVLIGIILSLLNLLRLMWNVFGGEPNIVFKKRSKKSIQYDFQYEHYLGSVSYIPLGILAILSLGAFLFIPLLISGEPVFLEIKRIINFSSITIPILLCAILCFCLFISYFISASKNPEIAEIKKLTWVKKINYVLEKEYYDFCVNKVLVFPLSHVSRFIQKKINSLYIVKPKGAGEMEKPWMHVIDKLTTRGYLISLFIGCGFILLILILY